MSETAARPRRIDAADLDDELAANDTLLVQFYTEGCSLCAAMESVAGNVGREIGTPVVFVNPRDVAGMIEEYRITSVPTLVVFRDGEEVGRLADGFVSGDELTAFVEKSLS
ncbi:MAG: thioredoxin family protein [Halobaculum sp.]